MIQLNFEFEKQEVSKALVGRLREAGKHTEVPFTFEADGDGVNISVDNKDRVAILRALLEASVRRFTLGPGFIHLPEKQFGAPKATIVDGDGKKIYSRLFPNDHAMFCRIEYAILYRNCETIEVGADYFTVDDRTTRLNTFDPGAAGRERRRQQRLKEERRAAEEKRLAVEEKKKALLRDQTIRDRLELEITKGVYRDGRSRDEVAIEFATENDLPAGGVLKLAAEMVL